MELNTIQNKDDNIELIPLYTTIGNFYLNTGKKNDALEFYNKAKKLTHKYFNNSTHNYKTRLYTSLGNYYTQNKNYVRALENYNRALSVFSFDITCLNAMVKKCQLLYETKQYIQVRDVCNKALGLVDTLRGSYLSYKDKFNLLENEQILYNLGLLSSYHLYISTGNDFYKTYALHYSDAGKYVVLNEKLKYNNRLDETILKRPELKNINILEYTFANDTLFMFFLKHDSLILKTTRANDLHKHIKYVAGSLQGKYIDDFNNDFVQYNKSTFYLYQHLIKPFEKHFASKELVVIPDEGLSMLCFEGFVDKVPDTEIANYMKNSYLLYRYAFSYGLNIQSYFKKSTTKTPHKILSFIPDFSNSPKLASINSGLEIAGFLKRKLNGKTISDSTSTKSNFLKSVNEYDCVFLPTHGMFDSVRNENYIIFYENSDNHLYSSEIMNHSIKCKLIIADACYSGVGEYKPGEGILNLGRAFKYAGVQSVILPLYVGVDQSSYIIFLNYFKQLIKGKSSAEALRLGKIEFIKHPYSNLSTHPIHWLNYVQIGNPWNCKFTSTKSKPIIIFVSVLLIFAGIILYRKKR